MYKLQNWDRSKLNGTAMAVKPAMAKAVVAQPAQMSGSSKARVRLPSRARDFPEFFRRRRKIPIPSFSVPKKTAFAPEKNNGLNIFNADQSGTFWPEFCAEPASVLSPMQLLLIFRSILGVGNYLFWQIFHLFFPRSLLTPPMNFWHPINLNRFDRVVMVAAVDRWSEFEASSIQLKRN